MNKTIVSVAAVAALLAVGQPAGADSKFSSVAPRSEHRSYGHYARQPAPRQGRYQRYRTDRYGHATRYRQRGHAAGQRRHYDADHHHRHERYRGYRHWPQYRHGRYRHGIRYGVRLGDGIYLSPHGLTLYIDLDD